MNPIFTLTRLFSNEMTVLMPPWDISWNTAIGYHWVEHRFCIDVSFLMDELNALAIAVTQNQKFITC